MRQLELVPRNSQQKLGRWTNRVGIRLPRQVDEGRSRNVYPFHASAVNVVKTIDEALEIAAMAELGACDILLEGGFVRIII